MNSRCGSCGHAAEPEYAGGELVGYCPTCDLVIVATPAGDEQTAPAPAATAEYPRCSDDAR